MPTQQNGSLQKYIFTCFEILDKPFNGGHFDVVLHVSVEEVIDIGRDKHTYIHGFEILGSVSQNFFLCN